MSPLSADVTALAQESTIAPFDCVVIGGGSSGLTAAITMVEHGKRVAVIEAGPAAFLTHLSNTDLRFNRALADAVRSQVQYSPPLQPGGSTFGPNFSCLGGRGLFWNGAAPRFQCHDFDGWPLGLHDLTVEYEWAEREFRVTTQLGHTALANTISDRLRAIPLDVQPGPYALDSAPSQPGRLSAGVASGLGMFLRGCGSAVVAGTLRVATNTVAKKIVARSGLASSVVVTWAGANGQDVEIAARSVVLAGGGVESIRLAYNSRLPDLSNRIGKGLQDHIFYRFYVEAPNLYGAEADAAVLHVPSHHQSSEQWEVHAPGRRLLSIDGAPWTPGAGEGYQLMIRAFAATEKRDANRVLAAPGALGTSPIQFEYSASDIAKKAAMESVGQKIAAALGATALDPRFAGPGASYHEAGGLDMGTDPETSVVDPEGAFHAVRNVVVADASAWPRIGATNPHLTLVALARRQATRLAQWLT